MSFKTDKQFAVESDSTDQLGPYRNRFFIPKTQAGKEAIYLCGNSLGLQPKTASAYVQQELEDWARLGVEGHFHAKNPWMPYHELLTEQTARLVGALPSEVVVMNTLTVNLHLMMVSFYRPTILRHKIIIEQQAFPSDQYAVKSQIKFHGFDPERSLVELSPRPGETTLRIEDIEEMLEIEGEATALILLGGVNYYTGQVFDMERITKSAQTKGCIVAFDLAHAAGNIPLHLHDWGVDFAVWCSYKYLNAGPGSTAGCFVHERHARSFDLPRFSGWWGHNKSTRFQMLAEFDPIPGAESWQLSNPSILPLAALRSSMEIFDEAGMTMLRAKSEKLTGYLEFLLRALPGVSILTPSDQSQRGCQLSLQIGQKGRVVFESLTRQGVICDWREPDVIRVAPVPLYNTFSDVFEFVKILGKEME
ncbi:MAG: kynureninase [Bacteroidota bacterium]